MAYQMQLRRSKYKFDSFGHKKDIALAFLDNILEWYDEDNKISSKSKSYCNNLINQKLDDDGLSIDDKLSELENINYYLEKIRFVGAESLIEDNVLRSESELYGLLLKNKANVGASSINKAIEEARRVEVNKFEEVGLRDILKTIQSTFESVYAEMKPSEQLYFKVRETAEKVGAVVDKLHAISILSVDIHTFNSDEKVMSGIEKVLKLSVGDQTNIEAKGFYNNTKDLININDSIADLSKNLDYLDRDLKFPRPGTKKMTQEEYSSKKEELEKSIISKKNELVEIVKEFFSSENFDDLISSLNRVDKFIQRDIIGIFNEKIMRFKKHGVEITVSEENEVLFKKAGIAYETIQKRMERKFVDDFQVLYNYQIDAKGKIEDLVNEINSLLERRQMEIKDGSITLTDIIDSIKSYDYSGSNKKFNVDQVKLGHGLLSVKCMFYKSEIGELESLLGNLKMINRKIAETKVSEEDLTKLEDFIRKEKFYDGFNSLDDLSDDELMDLVKNFIDPEYKITIRKLTKQWPLNSDLFNSQEMMYGPRQGLVRNKGNIKKIGEAKKAVLEYVEKVEIELDPSLGRKFASFPLEFIYERFSETLDEWFVKNRGRIHGEGGEVKKLEIKAKVEELKMGLKDLSDKLKNSSRNMLQRFVFFPMDFFSS
jgi:hypothetical protein